MPVAAPEAIWMARRMVQVKAPDEIYGTNVTYVTKPQSRSDARTQPVYRKGSAKSASERALCTLALGRLDFAEHREVTLERRLRT